MPQYKIERVTLPVQQTCRAEQYCSILWATDQRFIFSCLFSDKAILACLLG